MPLTYVCKYFLLPYRRCIEQFKIIILPRAGLCTHEDSSYEMGLNLLNVVEFQFIHCGGLVMALLLLKRAVQDYEEE